MSLSRVEIITGNSKLTGLKKMLSKCGVTGMTVMQVIGCGIQKGTMEHEVEENTEMELLPKQMIILYVQSEIVEHLIEQIKKELYTGHIGDGKIVVSDITNAVRIRTGEEGLDALS